MKRVCLAAALIVLAVSFAGCRSKAVSRTYEADMDTTWAAILRVAERLSAQKPLKVDRENGRIITGWIYGDVQHEYSSGYTTSKKMDIWRGIITCKPDKTGTKVTVELEKGYVGDKDSADVMNTEEKTVGYVFKTTDEKPQKKLLDEIASELAKKE